MNDLPQNTSSVSAPGVLRDGNLGNETHEEWIKNKRERMGRWRR